MRPATLQMLEACQSMESSLSRSAGASTAQHQCPIATVLPLWLCRREEWITLSRPRLRRFTCPFQPVKITVQEVLGITIYDSLYLALAERQDATLVTDDRRLLQAARRDERLRATGFFGWAKLP